MNLRFLLVLLLAIFLTACGQKGDLYLPEIPESTSLTQANY